MNLIDPERLGHHLVAVGQALISRGGLTFDRASDWTSTKGMPSQWTPGEDEDDDRCADGRSDAQDDDHREDAAASRYHDELAVLSTRMFADGQRMERIIAICNPPAHKSLQSRDMLDAQVAAEGLCVSCHRDDQHITEIERRPERDPNKRAAPYYKDRCRAFCGPWKAEHGQDPPLWIVVKYHRFGKRAITTVDAAKALGRTA